MLPTIRKHNVLVFEKGQTNVERLFHHQRPAGGRYEIQSAERSRDRQRWNDLRKRSLAEGRAQAQIWRITRDAERQGHAASVMTSARRDKMGMTNGIDLSPDGKTLYVSESTTREVWAYRIEGTKLVLAIAEGAENVRAARRTPSSTVCAPTRAAGYTSRDQEAISRSNQGRAPTPTHALGRLRFSIRMAHLFGKLERTASIRAISTFGGPDGKTVFVTQVDGGFIEKF